MSDPLGLIGCELEGKYRVEALAGEGGFSVVYRARHLVWDQPVAIKIFSLAPETAEDSRKQLLAGFMREGKLMSKLSSRCAAIVQARDVGVVEVRGAEQPYLVLEWLDGMALDERLSDPWSGYEPRDLRAAMDLLEGAAQALDLAHRVGIAHRDLKPANIFLAEQDGELAIKVMDFGIAKVMATHQERQEQLDTTGKHISAFTPNYGAPEQFTRSFGATGPWTDVFAMALILIEVMTGEPALAGDSFLEIGKQVCNMRWRPTPRGLGLDVSDEVEEVFARAVAVMPKDRYATMGEFWSALHKALTPDADVTWQGRVQTVSLSELLPDGDRLSGTDFMPGHLAETLSSDEVQAAPTLPLESLKPITVQPPIVPRKMQAAAVVVGGVLGVAVVALWASTGGTAPELASTFGPLAADAGTRAVAAAHAEPAPAPEPVRPVEVLEVPSAAPPPTAKTAPPPRRQPPPRPEPSEKAPDPFDTNNFGGRR